MKILTKIKEYLYSVYCRSPLSYNYSGLVAVCCIVKCENDYIREFVEYHLTIGFDKIYIYDNNDIHGERLEEEINDYIISDRVLITDYRGRTQCQTAAYSDCYMRHSKECSWIAFIDSDEFFTIVNRKLNVRQMLNSIRYLPYQILHINWMVYGDNNMLDNDGRPMVERFTQPKQPLDYIKPCSSHPYPENFHIKSIVRGGLKHISWERALNPHTPQSIIYRCANMGGQECNPNSPFNPIDYSVAYLRHYKTKTIGEYIKIKMKRGFPDQLMDSAIKKLTLEEFFYINEKTPEKEQYIKSLRCNENKDCICFS